MFNEVMFGEILLPVLGSVNDFVAHIQRKYADLDRNKRTCVPGQEDIMQCN